MFGQLDDNSQVGIAPTNDGFIGTFFGSVRVAGYTIIARNYLGAFFVVLFHETYGICSHGVIPAEENIYSSIYASDGQLNGVECAMFATGVLENWIESA